MLCTFSLCCSIFKDQPHPSLERSGSIPLSFTFVNTFFEIFSSFFAYFFESSTYYNKRHKLAHFHLKIGQLGGFRADYFLQNRIDFFVFDVFHETFGKKTGGST